MESHLFSEGKKQIFLLFPRTPLSSLSMSSWISSFIREKSNIAIFLAIPNLSPSLLNAILLPWQKKNFSTFNFDYDSLKYYTGIIGHSTSLSIESQRFQRSSDLEKLVGELEESLSVFGLSINDINNFCFTSEHPTLLHNRLHRSQNLFYFEHGFGDYAIFLSSRGFFYQTYSNFRKYIEALLYELPRSNFSLYNFVSIFCSNNSVPLSSEIYISDEDLDFILKQIKKEIIHNYYDTNTVIELSRNYFLVSLDQIEFFDSNELRVFISIIYDDFLKRRVNFDLETILLIKPREDISKSKLLELQNIVRQICQIDTIIFLGLKNLHLSSELICLYFNVSVIYTHGYTIPAFLARLNHWPVIINMNNFYNEVFGLKFYYRRDLKQLRQFQRHHRLIRKILQKYQSKSNFYKIENSVNE
jgi:hypothetical protein